MVLCGILAVIAGGATLVVAGIPTRGEALLRRIILPCRESTGESSGRGRRKALHPLTALQRLPLISGGLSDPEHRVGHWALFHDLGSVSRSGFVQYFIRHQAGTGHVPRRIDGRLLACTLASRRRIGGCRFSWRWVAQSRDGFCLSSLSPA